MPRSSSFFHWGISLVVLLFLGAEWWWVNRPASTLTLEGVFSGTPLASPLAPPAFPPARVLDLGRWKITLPIGSSEKSDDPLEITQPELGSYALKPWFAATPDKAGVVFRAPVNGLVTSGTKYPRSELREMTADGKENIFWSSTTGTHTLTIEQAITAVPKRKPEVVAGQIHGDDDDLLAIRLEYPVLFLVRGESRLAMLDENYSLGKRFTIRFVVRDGAMEVYSNDQPLPVYTLRKAVEEAYFKAGVYTQSNCETEESPQLCTSDNYGEVVIYRLLVTHAGLR